jgi:hypothetical protein
VASAARAGDARARGCHNTGEGDSGWQARCGGRLVIPCAGLLRTPNLAPSIPYVTNASGTFVVVSLMITNTAAQTAYLTRSDFALNAAQSGRTYSISSDAQTALVFAGEDACYIEQQALPGGCPKAMSAIREQFDPGVPKSVRIAFDVSPGDRPTSLVVAGSQLAIPP